MVKKQKEVKVFEPKAEDIEIVSPPAVTSLAEITRSEINIQIATAKRYPRSVAKFRQDALSMATTDEGIAASCFYKLKRTGKGGTVVTIEGPSVRLAEIVASAWGNLRFGARIIAENEKEVIAQGIAHDLERNVCNLIEVSRRIMDHEGRRYSDDMITLTKNAACSIALRNAIFKTVPFTYAKSIYEQAKKVAVGSTKTLITRRKDMLARFAELGVKEDKILAYIEKPSIEDIGLTEIEDLIGVYNAIKDGDSTVEQVFTVGKPVVEPPKPRSKFSNSAQHEIIKNLFKKIYKAKADETLSRALGEDYGIEKIEQLTLAQAEELITAKTKEAESVR